MENEIIEILKEIRGDINEIRGEISGIHGEINGIHGEINELKVGQEVIKQQVAENTEILKALEHKADVNKAEHDKMMNDIAHLQGDMTKVKSDVEFIKKDLNRVEEATANNWADIARLKAVK